MTEINIYIKQAMLFNFEYSYSAPLLDVFIYDTYDKICLDDLEYSINDIIWIYQENNYRIPHYNNKKVTCLKPNITDNIIDFISSAKIIDDANIISGEKFQMLADITIGTFDKILYNPNNNKFSKEIVNIDEIFDITKYNKIFVFTDNLEQFNNKFKDQLYDKIIISHNSDHGINDQYINSLNNIKKQYSQNCLILHKNLCAIPIGIENMQWFDHQIFHTERNKNVHKTKYIYFNFCLNTHPSRLVCHQQLKDKIEWTPVVPKKEYFHELHKHKYAICPRGNGLDTHRLWEALYLDVIPIVLKGDYVQIDSLPIIVLNSWTDLDVQNISNNFISQNISKISFKYWQDEI
jgi:hypothetical protein